jgi:hypothetical protein
MPGVPLPFPKPAQCGLLSRLVLPVLTVLSALVLPIENLRAQDQNGAVAQAYLYVEPYLARFEFLMDSRTAQRWLKPGTDPSDRLSPEEAATLAAKATTLAQPWVMTRVDGVAVAPRLRGGQWLKGRPGATLPLEKEEELLADETMLGLIWEIPAGPSPSSIQVEWSGFTGQAGDILPVTAWTGRAKETFDLREGQVSLTWNNEGRLPPPPPLSPVPELPRRDMIQIPLGFVLWCAAGLPLWLVLAKRRRPFSGAGLSMLAAWSLGALLTFRLLVVELPLGGAKTGAPVVADPAQAGAIVEPLLRNVHRAFDLRDEGAIYDVLARSAEGPLVKEWYLGMMETLALDNAEAARVTVKEFTAEVLEVAPEPTSGGFTALARWTTMGTVGHWGHNHNRVAITDGRLTIEPVRGQWKITALELVDQRRL